MMRHCRICKNRMWLLLLFAVISIATSGWWGVVESSEARYAEISREMLVSHDWIHPTLMGIYHYHKPPLTYWITSAGYSLFGVNPFGARFFLQICVVFQVVLVYRIVKLILHEEQVAFTASAIYASMNLVMVSMRGLTTDCYLNTFVLLAIFAWLKWRSYGTPGWLYVTSIAFALGFLTKGPLIFIVPVFLFIGFNNILAPRAFQRHHLLAFLLFILIGFSWYAALVFENRELLSYFLHRQTYERAVHAHVFSRNEPYWYYAAYLPLLLLPWSGIYIPSLFRQKSDPVIKRINLFWIAFPLLFFSLVSSKLVLYVLPVCSGVAIAVAYSIHFAKQWYQEWLVFILFLLLWGALIFMRWIDSSFTVGAPLMIIPAIAVVMLVTIRNIIRTNIEDRIVMYAITSTLLLLIHAAVFMNTNESRVNSTGQISQWLSSNSLSMRKVIIYNKLLPSIEFQSGKEVLTINAGDKHLQREVNFQRDDQWKNQLLNLEMPNANDSLRRLLKIPSVVIAKGNFHKTDAWIKSYFKNQYEEGEWIIYY